MKDYLRKINDSNYICKYRNTLLLSRYGKIPSYALWDKESIDLESHSEKISWLRDFLHEMHQKAQNEAMYRSSVVQEDRRGRQGPCSRNLY